MCGTGYGIPCRLTLVSLTVNSQLSKNMLEVDGGDSMNKVLNF